MIAEANEDLGFTRSRGCFDEVVGWLGAAEAGELEHAELEDRLEVAGRDLLRRLLQDHLDLRAQREARLADVVDVHGVRHGMVEDGHGRRLGTVFGPVTVSRLAYRHRGDHNLYPADAALNLPTERHSHGLRRLAAAEASRGSFDEAAAALERATGQHLGKRQVEALPDRAAVDVDAFYAIRAHPHAAEGEVLVISGRQGHRHATRCTTPSHRESGSRSNQQAHLPALEGGETEPQTPRRGRRRLRPHAGGPHPRRGSWPPRPDRGRRRRERPAPNG